MTLWDILSQIDIESVDMLHVGLVAGAAWYVKRKDVPGWFYGLAKRYAGLEKKDIDPAAANEAVSCIEERYGRANSDARRRFFRNPGNRNIITGERTPHYEPPDKLF